MIVVDASVALKWVIEEDGSDAAEALLLEEPLTGPDLLLVECANVLWTKARRGELRQERDAAGRPHEELDPVPGLQPEVLADGLRDGRLPLGRNRRLHGRSITFRRM
jgi:hypothetical protein